MSLCWGRRESVQESFFWSQNQTSKARLLVLLQFPTLPRKFTIKPLILPQKWGLLGCFRSGEKNIDTDVSSGRQWCDCKMSLQTSFWITAKVLSGTASEHKAESSKMPIKPAEFFFLQEQGKRSKKNAPNKNNLTRGTFYWYCATDLLRIIALNIIVSK